MNQTRIAVLVLALASSACADRLAPLNPVGEYEVSLLNGAALPVVLVQEPPPSGLTFTLHSGSLSLRADGSYTQHLCYGTPPAPPCQTSSVEQGTFTALGRTVTLTASSGYQRTMSLTPIALTWKGQDGWDGYTFTFRK